jgi:hypothetical protein
MRRYLAAVAIGTLTLVGCQSSQKARWSLQSRVISLDTQPPGAHVWQIAVPSGSLVDLGMTPIVDRQVSVMTEYHGSFTDPAAAQDMMSSFNLVRLRIEKPGYQPYDLTMTPPANQVARRSVTLEPAPATQPAPTTAAAAASASR